MLKQLGIDQRIVQQMIEEETALAEASRLGITATDAEVRTRILSMPAFQENGQFIGDAALPAAAADAEPADAARTSSRSRSGAASSSRSSRAALTDWITVTDKELDAEVKRRNEKVKLAVVAFPADKFREGVAADRRRDRGVLRRAQGRATRSPRSARSSYALVDMQAIRERTHGLRAGHPALLRGQPAAVLDARAGARQPHPAQDRRARTTRR